jgi:acyl carrier protein
MDQSPRDFVLSHLSRERPIPGETEEAQLATDYLRAELLDSLGLIELIGELETQLGVEFTQDDFEDPRFKTVGGLIEIAEERSTSA